MKQVPVQVLLLPVTVVCSPEEVEEFFLTAL